MTKEEAELTVDYLKSIQEGCVDGEGFDMHPLPEWYALDKAIELIEQTKWISVEEDTPPEGTICLWCNKQGSVFISEITYRSEYDSYVGKHGYFSNGLENHGDIVAWMPLPEPYKEDMRGGNMSENPTGSD